MHAFTINYQGEKRGRQRSRRNVEEDTTRSCTLGYVRRVLDLAILDNSFDELSLN